MSLDSEAYGLGKECIQTKEVHPGRMIFSSLLEVMLKSGKGEGMLLCFDT